MSYKAVNLRMFSLTVVILAQMAVHAPLVISKGALMKSIVTLSLAFVAVALLTSVGYANPRDAGSKIRGEAYEGTSEATRPPARYYYGPAQVVQAPAMTEQPQQAVVQSPAPAQAPANATAAVGEARSSTRTFSVEPQPAAPTMTYRTYGLRRNVLRFNDSSAGRKILGHYGY